MRSQVIISLNATYINLLIELNYLLSKYAPGEGPCLGGHLVYGWLPGILLHVVCWLSDRYFDNFPRNGPAPNRSKPFRAAPSPFPTSCPYTCTVMQAVLLYLENLPTSVHPRLYNYIARNCQHTVLSCREYTVRNLLPMQIYTVFIVQCCTHTVLELCTYKTNLCIYNTFS